jgi:hypothetical protein
VLLVAVGAGLYSWMRRPTGPDLQKFGTEQEAKEFAIRKGGPDHATWPIEVFLRYGHVHLEDVQANLDVKTDQWTVKGVWKLRQPQDLPRHWAPADEDWMAVACKDGPFWQLIRVERGDLHPPRDK